MTCPSRALVFVSVIVCTLLLRQSQGQDNATEFENATTSWTTSIAVTSSSAAFTSTIPPSNATTNGTIDDLLFFNSTNGTSVPLVGPTSAAPTQGSAGGGGQRFDVASFIGGIILAAGVIGLGVFIFKIYQSRQSEYSNI